MDIENGLVIAKRGGWRREGLEVWNYQLQTRIYIRDQQGPTIYHRELYSMSYDKP